MDLELGEVTSLILVIPSTFQNESLSFVASLALLTENLGERAFQAAAPQLWNELPLQLRTIGSVEIFKNSIKTFLFKRFFNSE